MASEPPHSLQLLLNHRRSESGYFSKLRSDVVLVASCTLTDLATANIPGTRMRPTTGVLQLAELNLRTRVVELLSLGAEGGCLTFDDAFNKAFIEKQSLFHCALSPQSQVNNVAKPPSQRNVPQTAALPIAKRDGKQQIPRARNLGQGRSIPNTLPMVLLFALTTTLVAVHRTSVGTSL